MPICNSSNDGYSESCAADFVKNAAVSLGEGGLKCLLIILVVPIV